MDQSFQINGHQIRYKSNDDLKNGRVFIDDELVISLDFVKSTREIHKSKSYFTEEGIHIASHDDTDSKLEADVVLIFSALDSLTIYRPGYCPKIYKYV